MTEFEKLVPYDLILPINSMRIIKNGDLLKEIFTSLYPDKVRIKTLVDVFELFTEELNTEKLQNIIQFKFEQFKDDLTRRIPIFIKYDKLNWECGLTYRVFGKWKEVCFKLMNDGFMYTNEYNGEKINHFHEYENKKLLKLEKIIKFIDKNFEYDNFESQYFEHRQRLNLKFFDNTDKKRLYVTFEYGNPDSQVERFQFSREELEQLLKDLQKAKKKEEII